MKMNPVVHFELPADDMKRMSDFYTNVFGWGMQQMGPDMGNYMVVTTTETDEKRMIKNPGAINGGFMQKTKATSHPSVVIAVDDIYEAIKKVREAGGTIVGGEKVGEPDNIPGIGLYISFTDTEGNRISMLQPNDRG